MTDPPAPPTPQHSAHAAAVIEIDLDRELGRVGRRIYGQFLESAFFGNIEGGVLDETSSLASTDPPPLRGLRRDVIDACRKLGIPVVRWPGGNFASAYHWTDGVGPRERRPRRLELAWGEEESNRFGTDEFLAWCEAVGAEPYLVHSCRDVEEAARWVEYVNYAGSTSLTALRAANGHPRPWDVRLWGIGNEVYGRWQMGHRGAAAYAADAREHAEFMRRVDPSLELVAVGALPPLQEEWARALLTVGRSFYDFVSLHLYAASLHRDGTDDYDAVVSQPRYFEDEIASCAAVLESVSGELGLEQPPAIALDEWNIRHLEPATWPEPRPGERGGAHDVPGLGGRRAGDAPEPTGLRVNRYSSRTLADALFYAGVFHVLHRLSGLAAPVRMANTVNLVNANALLEVRPAGVVRSASYHVWDLYQNHLGPRVVRSRFLGPDQLVSIRQGAESIENAIAPRTAALAALDIIATSDEARRTAQAAVINRHRRDVIDARLVGVPPTAHVWDLGVDSAQAWATNSLDQPDHVATVDRGVLSLGATPYRFAPHSVTILEWTL